MRKGLDVSHHQGRIDWPTVARGGYEWASVKATEAYGFVDKQYKRNVRLARKQGIEVVPYHFAHPRNDPVREAAHFMDVVAGELKVCLDWEWRLSGHSVAEQADWIREFAKNVPGPMLLYGSYYPLLHLVGYGMHEFPLWLARPRKNVDVWPKVGTVVPAVWQHSWKGKVPGIAGDVDLDLVRR